AALSAGIITPYTPQLCSGAFDLGGTIFHNVEAGVYEDMTLTTALAQSCDTWFYRLGDRIWQADPSAEGALIERWAHKLGLGRRPARPSLQACAEAEALSPSLGDQAGALRGGALGRGNVGQRLLELPDPCRRQDRNGSVVHRLRRPFLVRVVGALQPPEAAR